MCICIYIHSQDHQKNIYCYETQKIPKTLTFINTSTKQKHLFSYLQSLKKTIMACSYLIFNKYFLHSELFASITIKNESIHLISWHHSHKKQKNSLETQAAFLIFLPKLEISEVAIQRIHQNSKKW